MDERDCVPWSVSLAVEVGGIVAHGKKDHENLPIGNLRRIEDDLHGFSVASLSGADILVVGRFCCAAGIAGCRGDHTFQVLEDSLNAPEAATGKDSCFLRF